MTYTNIWDPATYEARLAERRRRADAADRAAIRRAENERRSREIENAAWDAILSPL